MTKQAAERLVAARAELNEVLDALALAQFDWPSACPGWSVRDVVAHLGASARNAIDPLPPLEGSPQPAVRERVHDLNVIRRRAWPLEEVLEEFRTYGPQAAAMAAAVQEEPQAHTPVSMPGLGQYPMHALANAALFDTYCHLRHDLLAPRGPLAVAVPDPDHESLYAVIQWMMWGLPQMQGPELVESLVAPVEIRLTGPGQSTWSVERNAEGTELTVTEDGRAPNTVTSTAHDFVAWATRRQPWMRYTTVEGDELAVRSFLGVLSII